jgi:hypothetical protein
MELSATQRKLVFAVIVFVLAGLGVYLISRIDSGSGQASPAPTRPAAQHPRRPARTSPASSPSSSAPAVSPSATSTQAPDIYQWLPFTKSGLASAASLTVRFGQVYGTFSYTEKTSAYLNSLRSLISTQLAGQIGEAYSTPGVASRRVKYKQVSTGTASITSLRAFGPTSLTFVVAMTEHVTATKDGGTTTTSYAVTVTGGDNNWQVSDIEYASAGNQ